MSGTTPPHDIIIVKRLEEEEHEAHSSAWKVAHADFMTAMMAFFLIMWLINATDEDVRKTIAQYFNPINLSDDIVPRKGLTDPQEEQDEGTSDDGAKPSAVKNTQGANVGQGEDVQQGAREQALFQDPYASIAAIAAKAKEPADTQPDVTASAQGKRDAGTGDAQRDPFDPAYWQSVAGAGGTSTSGTQTHAATGPQGAVAMQGPAAGQGAAAQQGAAAAQGAASPAVRNDLFLNNPAASPTEAKANAGRAGSWEKPGEQSPQNAQKLEAEIAAAVSKTGAPQDGPHVEVRITKEGLVINLTDDANFSMFAVGSAQPNPQLVQVMDKVAKVLAGRSGQVVIRGYTDGRPFRSDLYDNWRLSTARAHMAHYMLTRSGLEEKRIAKIEGLADRNLKNPGDPNAPENRRIEILLKEPVS